MATKLKIQADRWRMFGFLTVIRATPRHFQVHVWAELEEGRPKKAEKRTLKDAVRIQSRDSLQTAGERRADATAEMTTVDIDSFILSPR